MKGLIGIILYGVVLFIFLLYIGLIFDREIIRCSGILDLLEYGDFVMVDKGFNIDDLFKEKGVGFNIFFFF